MTLDEQTKVCVLAVLPINDLTNIIFEYLSGFQGRPTLIQSVSKCQELSPLDGSCVLISYLKHDSGIKYQKEWHVWDSESEIQTDQVNVWNAFTISFNHNQALTFKDFLALAPNFVAFMTDHRVAVWDLALNRFTWDITSPMQCTVMCKSQEMLLWGGTNGHVCGVQWPRDVRGKFELAVHDWPVISLAVLDTNKFVSSCQQGQVAIWNFSGVLTLVCGQGQGQRTLKLVAFVTNDFFASISANGNVWVWSATTHKCVQVFELSATSIAAMRSNFFIIGTSDGHLWLLDAQNSQVIKLNGNNRKDRMHDHRINSIIVLENGSVISRSRDQTCLWK